MRLYPLGAAQTVIEHPVRGRIEAGDDGGFDLGDDLSDELHSFHVRGRRIWETEDERSDRKQREGLAARRDPAALFDTVSGMADLTRQLAEFQLGQSGPSKDKPLSPEDEIAALERRLAELKAADGEDKLAPKTSSRTPVKAPPGKAEGKPAE